MTQTATITSIKRDFNLFPNIVGIVTTANLATITTAGYFTNETDNVNLINNGVWEWEDEDLVLIYYATNKIGYFTFNATTQSFVSLAASANSVDFSQLSLSVLQTAVVPLTSAQIKGMYATPVQLLPAPGIGKLLIIDSIIWDMAFGTAQYVAGGIITAQYGNTIHGNGTAASGEMGASTLNSCSANAFLSNGGNGSNLFVGSLMSLNTAIYLSNQFAAFINGDSSATLYIRYYVLTPA
jgi:hypothetical protein